MLSFMIYSSTLFHYVHSSCGYADMSAYAYSFKIGQFILSTDKCQAISNTVEWNGQSQDVDGGIMASCDANDNTKLIVNEYTSPLCLGSPSQTLSVAKGEDILLLDQKAKFKLNDFVCSNTDCGIDITLSNDCAGTDSSSYTNLAIPPNSCQTFVDDFLYGTFLFKRYGLNTIPVQILTDATANALFETALKFKCCQQDHSLVIFNYSEANCDDGTAYNLLRLSNDYNGQCFALGNQQLPFNSATNKAATSSVNTDPSVFAVQYTWNCDSTDAEDFVDCTDIEFMDDAQIMNVCPDHCLPTLAPTVSEEPTFNSSERPTFNQSEESTFEPSDEFTFNPSAISTFNPSAAPTFQPIVSDHSSVTVQPQNAQQGEDQPLVGISNYVLIGVVVIICLVSVIMIGLCVNRKKKMKRQVAESNYSQIEKADSRQQPMISAPELITDGDAKETNVDNDGTAGQYVLPITNTTDGTEDNKANLLSE